MPYLNVTEVESALSVATSAPFTSFTQLITLPNLTWESRQCHAIKIANGSGSGRPGVYFLGGIHSREWGSSDILINFVEQLEQAYHNGTGLTFGSRTFSVADIQTIVNTLDIVVFPQANPDGRNYSINTDAMWRKNRRTAAPNSPTPDQCTGVDINRNYDFLWNYPAYFNVAGSGIVDSTDPCDYQLYNGPSALSEPETENAKWIFDNFPNVRFFIDLHSYGEDILYSWGDDEDQSADPNMNFRNPAFDGTRGVKGDAYKEYIPANDLSTALNLANALHDGIQAFRGRNYTVKSGYDLYPTAGTSDDYAYSRHFVDGSKSNVIAYTLEWGSPANSTPFHPAYSEMQNIIQEVTSGLLAFCLWICNNSLKIQNFYFVAEKNNFGHDEVKDTLIWSDAFYLFLEGYSPADIAASLPNLTGSFNSSNIPGLTITHSGTTYDVGNTGNNANLPQRIRFAYDIAFTPASLPVFPHSNPPKSFELDATIQMQGQTLPFAPKLEFFLLAGADPYFTNLRNGSGYFYLSQDLRVFTGTGNSTPIPGTGAPHLTDSYDGAYQYISNLITYLNQQIGYLNPSYTPPDTNSSDPLDSLLPNQNGALDGDSTVTPKTGSANNYNFAIARVRLKGSSGHAGQAANAKVFFRLFTTQTFDTDFIDNAAALSAADPNITYPSDGGSDPSFPRPGTDGSGHINGCSLPFFATANYTNNPTDYNPGGANNQTIIIPHKHDYAWAFFGCFLNVYDLSNVIGGSSVQGWLPASAHSCLVAQIAFSDAPIVNANGVIENPENSDKLAQRNLQVTPSGNPGFPATHRVPQTIDVRPSQVAPTKDRSSILSYPDEIMIDWGRVPIGSVANLYWPAVNAASVLELAAQFYASHKLTAVDSNTIQIQVASNVTYVPIPFGTGGSLAGLFTLDLPASIRVGEEFDIVVRRITTKRTLEAPPPPPPPQIKRSRTVAPMAVVHKPLLWRYITGAFLVKVPVQKENTILPGDENLLSILKWRLGLIGPGNRWYPVLLRYISYLSQRITGMGGNPAKIPPSPHGYQPSPPSHRPKEEETYYTGKVTGMFFDRFGDFEGFILDTEDGERKLFSREKEIEELAERAWQERLRITVCVEHHSPHQPECIIIREPPAPFQC